MARTPEAFAKSGIEVKLHTKVINIRPEKKVLELTTGETLPFDYLTVATGATPRLPSVPGQDLEGIFFLRNVADAIRIKSFIKQRNARGAVIIGAGLISLEVCEAFRRLGLETTVVYRKDLPMRRLGQDFAEQILIELESNGAKFMASTLLEGFEPTSSGTIMVHTSNGTLESDLVLIGIGVVPEVSLASEAGIEVGPTGAIAVNENMLTNYPFIYAAGDCCECFHRVSRKPVHAPLGDIANKQGRIAGANIGGQKILFPGIVGSLCFKVFNLEVASTGLTLEEAEKAGFKASSATIQGVSKAHSYPGSLELQIRLVADTETGRFLGAQSVGGDGVVSRINALAVALTGGLSIEELAYVDLAYAPPFSGTWDPIHIAAQKLLK
ncbi:MAG: FAD-dependent oxidoreductase [Deltaproteobacteria bacterium]|nr:FAD-dependent oxidoreductase [Deltaproteobacteria bacterium]